MPPETDLEQTVALAKAAAEAIEALKKSSNLDEAGRKVFEYKNAWEALQTKLERVRVEGSASREEITRLEASTASAKRVFEAAAQALGGFQAALLVAGAETRDFDSKMDALSGTFAQIGASGHPLVDSLKNLGRTMVGTGAMAMALGNDTVRNLIMPFSGTQEIIGTLPRAFQNWNAVMRQSAEGIDLVNTAFLSYGRTLDDAKRPAALLVDEVARISQQFGISKKDAQEFMAGLKGVPGAFDSIGKSVEGTAGNLSHYTQLLQIARIAGMDKQKVAELMTIGFERFGQKGAQAAAETIANFRAAIAGTDIPMAKAMSQIQAASEPLAIFGRKMTEATNVWKTFTTALKDVPVDEVGKLVSLVSQNIANMNLGTQAFVAQMSGMVHGVTALGGALRMELAMREPGGMERNLEKVMQTISRMGGGRIITLQEAGQTPALEMQFQLQRQMVNQMLGIQGGQQQSRVLEVLQGIEKGGVSGVDASKELQGMMDEGQKAQNQSVTLLERIVFNTGRMTEFMNAMRQIEERPKTEMVAAGRALGARAAGGVPQEEAARTAGLHFARAGHQFAAAIRPATAELGGTLMRSLRGAITGVRAYEMERRHGAQRAADGPLIDVRHPERTEQPFVGQPLPMVPWTTRQERQEQRAGTVLPFWRRQEEPVPLLGAGAEPTMGGRRSRVPARPAAETEAVAEGERYLAAPMEAAPSVRISVVCEKCLEKKIYEATRKGSSEAKGDHY